MAHRIEKNPGRGLISTAVEDIMWILHHKNNLSLTQIVSVLSTVLGSVIYNNMRSDEWAGLVNTISEGLKNVGKKIEENKKPHPGESEDKSIYNTQKTKF